MVADASLVGTARAVVLDPVAGKYLNVPIIHPNRHLNRQFAPGTAQHFPHTVQQTNLVGGLVVETHITEMVGNFAAHLTRDEMAYGAQERGLNWGSIRAPDELVDEGHLNDRGFWVEVPHPELDRSFKYPGPAGIYNGSPWRISRRAPLIGEHNEEIYCGELGLQRTELAYLAESGVV